MDPAIKRHLYNVWYHMKSRCYDPKNNRYIYYGAKDVRICDRWLNFHNFIADMYPSFKKGLTIDRINVKGNYEPENCRWIEPAEQYWNRTDNHWITFKGVTKALTQWAKELGIKKTALHNRLTYYNWSIEKALTTPSRNRKVGY